MKNMLRSTSSSGPEGANKWIKFNSFQPCNLRVDLHILLGGEHVLLALLKAIVEHVLKDVDRLLVCTSINEDVLEHVRPKSMNG